MSIPCELDSLANARRCKAPAVFVSAGGDELVPPKYHRMVIDAYAGPKQVIVLKDAGHNTPPDEREERQIRRAVESLLSEESSGHARG